MKSLAGWLVAWFYHLCCFIACICSIGVLPGLVCEEVGLVGV